MWYAHYEDSILSRIFKYLFWVVIILWVIVSFVLGYFYLLSTGSQINKKGGTFVEGIFDQVSYLPYLKNDAQSVFYQGFLFRSCLNLYEVDEYGRPTLDLCRVYTEDHKNYVLRLIADTIRSDGVQVSIEDIFFTYDEIIRQNRWGIESLNTWNSITVALEDGRITVGFPSASKDNEKFFTNYILPRHILFTATLDQYRTDFAVSPVYNDCASVLTQNKDINSLIFDLGKCEDTHFAYYQIKNYGTFENFSANSQGEKKSIVDVYESAYALEGFTGKNILTSKLMGVFFNTDSDKVKVRLRRALGGFIYENFYTGNYTTYLSRYDGTFFNYYVSDGTNVQEFINRISLSDSEINTQDLKDSGAKELPESITINGVDRKFIFFLQKPESSRNLEIKFSNEFENIKITAPNNAVFTPKSYKKADKKVTYKLTTNDNLKVGANQYTIVGSIRGKTYTIASIDIYVFEHLEPQNTAENQRKLNILYYSEPSSIFVAQQLRTLFKEADILDNFIFEEVFNPEELEGKLLMGSYDIYIGNIDFGSKGDVLALFSTEEALLNPSKYRNPILAGLIRQYARNPDQNVIREINVILAQDMPVVLLGNIYTPLQMTIDIAEGIFPEQQVISEERRRYEMYRNYAIVHNVHINPKEAFKRGNFSAFIFNKLSATSARNTGSGPVENPFENLVASLDQIEDM